MSRKNAEILLAAVVLARSASFLFSKILLDTMGPFNLMGIRFLLAGGILLLIFSRRFADISRRTLCKGAILGFCFFLVMTFELFGLETVSSSSAALLEGTAIIFVPIFESLLSKTMPSKRSALSAALTFFGVALLTSGGGGFRLGAGELSCLAAAVTYAAGMIVTDRLTDGEDSIVLGTLQVTFMGIFGMAASLLTESPSLPASPESWGAMLFLVIICSSFGFAMQPVAQKYTTSERTAVLGALNPMGAAVLGMIFLHETMGLWGIAGAGLIAAGLLFQNAQKQQSLGN